MSETVNRQPGSRRRSLKYPDHGSHFWSWWLSHSGWETSKVGDTNFAQPSGSSVDEQGEICVKSPQCFAGYLGTDSARVRVVRIFIPGCKIFL